ncbi:endoglucanase [Salix suchowensis]|nr:endoglucanase [Salix suchowensis]
MHSANYRGGSFEIYSGTESTTDDEKSRNIALQPQHHHLDETQQSWLLYPEETKKKKYVDLGCVSKAAWKWTLYAFVFQLLLIAPPTILAKTLPQHESKPPPAYNYTLALQKALLFFNAQKSGKLTKNNGIPWRGDSGLQDGNSTGFSKGLVGGYYDAGDNAKFHFPMAFAMTMLSWSVIEYSQKYEAIGEYQHTRDLIRWGTDYLLLTFNSSASKIDRIYCQVPDDHYCWQRPEDMDYPRPVRVVNSGPDLAGEMAAALAAASIVFRDNKAYSAKLVRGAAKLYAFARDFARRRAYSSGNDYIATYYNSSGYYDEYIWGATWLYYATRNISYLKLAIQPGFAKHSKALSRVSYLSVPSWDNKLPAAMLLLTRYRLFLNPGYPYEGMLIKYHEKTELNMCSYFQQFNEFNWTRGGMIKLNQGRPQPLQFVANTAFLASLYVDYLNATGVPGLFCGPQFISPDLLRSFATSQINYILGDNPMKMSYVVGYGTKFPRHVHHRGASTPTDKTRYSCTGGWKWRDSSKPNPHNITGAMVGGPDRFDQFRDVRTNYNFTEPTLAGNAGLVAALASLTSSGGIGIDKNSIFAALPPLYPPTPPPLPAWKP